MGFRGSDGPILSIILLDVAFLFCARSVDKRKTAQSLVAGEYFPRELKIIEFDEIDADR